MRLVVRTDVSPVNTLCCNSVLVKVRKILSTYLTWSGLVLLLLLLERKESRKEAMSGTDKTVWMSAKEVMAVLECSRDYVLAQVAKGVIVRRQTSAHRRYLRESVERLAASQQETQPA